MSDKSVKRKKAERIALMAMGGVLLVIAMVLLVIFLIRGQTKIQGGNPEPVGSTALSCESSITKYPFFEDDNATARNLRVNAILENDKVKSISLFYKLTYKTESRAAKEKDLLRAAISTALQNSGVGVNVINDTYVSDGTELTMNLYLNGSKLDEVTEGYFMLDNTSGAEYNMVNLQKMLAAKGLKCVENS